MDRDEVDDGKEDLDRAEGDQRAHIQALKRTQEAPKRADPSFSAMVGATLETDAIAGVRRVEAESAAAIFSAKHDALASKIRGQSKGLPEPPGPSGTASSAPGAGMSSESSAAKSEPMLQLTKRRSQDQKVLATFNKRWTIKFSLPGYMKDGSASSPESSVPF